MIPLLLLWLLVAGCGGTVDDDGPKSFSRVAPEPTVETVTLGTLLGGEEATDLSGNLRVTIAGTGAMTNTTMIYGTTTPSCIRVYKEGELNEVHCAAR